MLAELTPRQLCEWRAALDVLGLDDQWRQAGTVAATFSNKLEQVAAGMAGLDKVPKRSLKKPEDYIPLIKPKGGRARAGGMMTPGELLGSVSALMRR